MEFREFWVYKNMFYLENLETKLIKDEKKGTKNPLFSINQEVYKMNCTIEGWVVPSFIREDGS